MAQRHGLLIKIAQVVDNIRAEMQLGVLLPVIADADDEELEKLLNRLQDAHKLVTEPRMALMRRLAEKRREAKSAGQEDLPT